MSRALCSKALNLAAEWGTNHRLQQRIEGGGTHREALGSEALGPRASEP